MKNLIDFYERYLGQIEYNWNSKEEDCIHNFEVVVIENTPFDEAATFATLGMSNKALYDFKKVEFYQELVFVAKKNFGDENIPGILMQVADMVLNSGKLLFRGDLIGPAGPIFEDSDLEALYVTAPAYFDDDFQMVHLEPNKDTIIVWLVPITKKEAEYVEKYGWEKFEDLLEEYDPDLTDFYRKSIV